MKPFRETIALLAISLASVAHAGKLPINLSVQAFYNVATPRYGACQGWGRG